MLKWNVRIYGNCPKKALKPDIMEYNSPSTPGLSQFWGSTCPQMHTHMNDAVFLLCPKRKKKRLT